MLHAASAPACDEGSEQERLLRGSPREVARAQDEHLLGVMARARVAASVGASSRRGETGRGRQHGGVGRKV